MTNLEQSIKKTISYAKKFGAKLNRRQLEKRLISNKVYSRKEINDFLIECPEIGKKIKSNNNFNDYYKTKLEKALALSKLIEQEFNSIIFLGITGSVAAENSKNKDDIDLLIITKKNQLWLTRLKLRWFIYQNKIPHRKYGSAENKDQFCFNLWLDENSLELPINRQNLKNAVDLILLKPMINKNKTYERFLLANSWVKQWVATGYYQIIKPSGPKFRTISLKKGDLFNYCLNFLVFVPQFLYMRPKIRNEEIGLKKAFFHKK